ncbi:MAG: SPASM domain-containing protein, partial [Candidatus Aminicenantales bacterium]
PSLIIRVDCALSFVQRHLPKELATKFGLKGCVAADRILALAPDGSSYPCSQLIHPTFLAGNLVESKPEFLWDHSPILRKYRSFRNKKAFTHSWCGICQAKDNCGGCRVFASDGLGGDPGCPEPLLPPLTQLDKIGRSLEWIGSPAYLKDYPEWIRQQINRENKKEKGNNEDSKYTERVSSRP